MIYRCIAPDWALQTYPNLKKVIEAELTLDEVSDLNSVGYNIYSLPNYPKIYDPNTIVKGSDIDTFEWVFLDMDLKDQVYQSKDEFIAALANFPLEPTRIVDSGRGIHVYWRISDLDGMNFLKLSRRLMRLLKTDEAVQKIYQLMRVPGTINTKDQANPKLCEIIYETDKVYTCEQLDKALPILSPEDAEYCQSHFNKTYHPELTTVNVDDKIPLKFGQLLENSKEAKEIWTGNVADRSAGDYRLGHIMLASGFTRDEALSVLINSAKALPRSPQHRIGYAQGIVDKIWTFEPAPKSTGLSSTVKDILQKGGDTLRGERFPCHKWLDDTHHGFRLGQVVGLVAGSGVGKTAVALNMFMGFVEKNPNYEHFFVPLEQPANEIADRWRVMCGSNTYLYEKVHIISNYADDGTFRHLSFDEIKDYILAFQKETGKKVGCVVIDHIGALKKKGKDGENQDLMQICHAMKAFAVQTNTMLVMQSQSSREKAGIGDLELNKDAAYGTVYFESYCDYLVTIWQPLKRMYNEPKCPTVTAFKFCKIRHKRKGLDAIQEDVCYSLFFDSNTEKMRQLTQSEEVSFDFFNKLAINKRKGDHKTELIEYVSRRWDNGKS